MVVGKTIGWKLGWDVKGSLLDGGWFQIAAGILLYFRVNRATSKQIHCIHAILALGVLVSLRNPSSLLDFYPNHDMERFVAYSFALLASLLYPYDQRLKQAKLLRPLKLVGGMSYSVYLCHPLIAKGISFSLFRWGVQGNAVTLLGVLPLCLGVSLVAAFVFHRSIERHFIPGSKTAGDAAPVASALPMRVPAAVAG